MDTATAGATVSFAAVVGVEAVLTFPAASVAVAVARMVPSFRVDMSMALLVQLPEPLAVPEAVIVWAFPASVTVRLIAALGSEVPETVTDVLLVRFTVGTVTTTGGAGSTVSTVKVREALVETLPAASVERKAMVWLP